MPTPNEIERLAAATNAIRPDWPVQSLRTHLASQHGARTFRDLAVALAWIATDPATKTPARLLENGPWWAATSVNSVKAGERQRCPEHDVPLDAGQCGPCHDATSDYQPGRAAAMWLQVKKQKAQEQ